MSQVLNDDSLHINLYWMYWVCAYILSTKIYAILNIFF